jgi:putative PIN family toxin of toxin-antitoxin system
MRRAVLDTNVYVSAVVKPGGVSARAVEQMRGGELEAVISPELLTELGIVLRRDKFQRRVGVEFVEDFLEMLRAEATLAPDPTAPAPLRSRDPKDDYLLALAFHQKALLVTGDWDLIELSGGAPIITPADLFTEPA